MTSHYTTTTMIHDFRSALGWPLNTFLWTLTILWSWPLIRWIMIIVHHTRWLVLCNWQFIEDALNGSE